MTDYDNVYVYATIALAIPTAVWLVMYFIPVLMTSVLPPVDIKQRYNCEWALVTGAGTGIGRSLAVRLAYQGLNIVVVSMADKHLDATVEMLRTTFPNQEFRKVGVTFAVGQDYMTPIIEATKDITVQAVFNNAGYIVTGFFEQRTINDQLNNVECNAIAAVKVTHHFIAKLIEQKLRGCIVFTSSVSGYIPNPFACMYGATKAFVSQFAASLNAEVAPLGIDVCAVHPSPVASNFYDNAHKLDALEMAKKAAVSPDAVPDSILQCVGRSVYGDIGGMAVGVRAGTFFIPYNMLSTLFGLGAPYMGDYQTHAKTREGKGKKA